MITFEDVMYLHVYACRWEFKKKVISDGSNSKCHRFLSQLARTPVQPPPLARAQSTTRSNSAARQIEPSRGWQIMIDWKLADRVAVTLT